jgi:single-strand DNA-binding protein
MLIGNLGRDAETRFTPSNVEVTNFSMATTWRRKDQSGNWTDETTWHNVAAFNLSDFYKNALRKGAKVYVEGRINTREYEKDGQKRYYTEIIANQIIPLDPREARQGGSYGGGQSDYGGGQPSGGGAPSSKPPTGPPNEEDDLPF